MVEAASQKVKQITEELYQGNYIDEMTVQWLSQTPNPPRVAVFYTRTKIHKSSPVGRPIVAGNDRPTERLSAFVDNILQSIAKSQKSHLKDTTDFANFIERTTLPEGTFLVSLDVNYQPIHKYPTGGGNKHSMQSIREFLRGQHPHPHPIPQRNSKAYPSRKFI